jgi:hypothetical protein
MQKPSELLIIPRIGLSMKEFTEGRKGALFIPVPPRFQALS